VSTIDATAKPARRTQATPTPATEREHERILAAYGGTYDDPKLEALIGKVVDRLVAASDRPDQAYKVTILNSGAVNAFALPTGQLYVTRGLVALASDTSELSSVLSHEMAHVLSKHAAIREDQARQAAVVARVVTDMSNDPDVTAFTLAKSKLTMASFSRVQEFEADDMGVAISARAHFDPYGASRFLTSMERNAELKAGKSSLDPRAQDFLSSHPATPERVQRAQNAAKQYASPDNTERDREDYLSAIDNLVYGEDPSEGFVRGRRFLHPKLGFTFQAPEAFTLDNTAQAVIGVRDGGSQAMRFDVVRVPAEQTLGEYLNSGWMENVDKATTEGKITIGVLVIVSIFSWTVIITKSRQLYRARKMAGKFFKTYRETRDPLEIARRGDEFDGAPAYELYYVGAEELEYQLKNNPVQVVRVKSQASASGPTATGT